MKESTRREEVNVVDAPGACRSKKMKRLRRPSEASHGVADLVTPIKKFIAATRTLCGVRVRHGLHRLELRHLDKRSTFADRLQSGIVTL